jgi:hypothetical protein
MFSSSSANGNCEFRVGFLLGVDVTTFGLLLLLVGNGFRLDETSLLLVRSGVVGIFVSFPDIL